MTPKEVRINAGSSYDCLYPSVYLISRHCFTEFYKAEEEPIATSTKFYGSVNNIFQQGFHHAHGIIRRVLSTTQVWRFPIGILYQFSYRVNHYMIKYFNIRTIKNV